MLPTNPPNYASMTLEELLKEVDLLNTPDFSQIQSVDSMGPVDILPTLPVATQWTILPSCLLHQKLSQTRS